MTTTTILAPPVGFGPANGRTDPRYKQPAALRIPTALRRRAGSAVSLAAAAVLLLAIAGGLLALRLNSSGPNGGRFGSIPAVQVSPEATPTGTATVVVKVTHLEGHPARGACFAAVLVRGPGRIQLLEASGCDPDDGADDGTTVVEGIPAGQEVVVYVSVRPSGGNRLPSGPSVVAEPGETVTLYYGTSYSCNIERPELRCADITITEGSDVEPADRVCYALFHSHSDAPGQFLTLGCDPPTSGDARTGATTIRGIQPGRYWVVRIDETGESIGKPMPVEILEDEDIELTWQED